MVAAPNDLEQLIAPPAVEETEEIAAPAAEEVAAETEAAAELSTEGAVPGVGEATVAAAEATTASDQAYGDLDVDELDLEVGMHRPEDFQAMCNAAGVPERWDARMANGFTGARGWVQPADSGHDMTFTLAQGQSAAQAIKDFIAGPTVADFRTIAVAVELDELRLSLGDDKFDQAFGATQPEVDAGIVQRLTISADMYGTQFGNQALALIEERDAAAARPPEPLAAPVLEPRVEEVQVAQVEQPAPELIAEELGLERDRERDQQLT
jgi:hypothetical protein